MSTVHVVAPAGIDDPARPSGGNHYDRRVCSGLSALGWSVREHLAPGGWPQPDPAACHRLAGVLASLADGALVLLDGLIASCVPRLLEREAARLRLVALMHMPLDDPSERAAMLSVAAIITTSDWTRRRLLASCPLRPGAVHVAEPGVDAAELAPGTAGGGELLCVGAVTPGKGHDVLLDALAILGEPRLRCVCVGSVAIAPDFVRGLRRQALAAGIAGQVCFTGPRVGAELATAYAGADLLVSASRAETYAMVVAEALARGLPVIATDVGGVAETLGRGADGRRPGLLVAPGSPDALAAALRDWLGDADLRAALRRTARERRSTLAGWPDTVERVARVLAGVAA